MNVFIWNTRNVQQNHLELAANTLLGIQLLQFRSMRFKVFCKQYSISDEALSSSSLLWQEGSLAAASTAYYPRESYFCMSSSHLSSRPYTHTSSSREDSWSRGLAALGIRGPSLPVYSSLVLFTEYIIAPGYGLNIDSSRFRKHSQLFCDVWTKPEWLKFMESGCKTVIDQIVSVWQSGGSERRTRNK